MIRQFIGRLDATQSSQVITLYCLCGYYTLCLKKMYQRCSSKF